MDTLLLFCKGHCSIKLSINDTLVPESMELELASHNEDALLALSGPPSLSWLWRAVLSERLELDCYRLSISFTRSLGTWPE